MGRLKGWLVCVAGILGIAGCVTTGTVPPPRTAQTGLPVPDALKACGRAVYVGNQLFEICGIGPEGEATKAAAHKIYTETCGPIEVTDELRRFFCQKADAMFAAMNPTKSKAFIAANFEDKTRILYNSKLGNAVHYTTADGRAYFWEANQTRVIVGKWMVFRNAQICFYVPRITEHSGTKWVCGPLQSDELAEIADGDVAELSKHRGAVPWVLTAHPRVTLADVVQRLKSRPSSQEGDKPATKPVPSAPVGPSEKEPLGPLVMNN